MNGCEKHLVVVAVMLLWTATATAQPVITRANEKASVHSGPVVITDLNGTQFARSGRVAITGSGFGAGGEVVIAGLSAWTSTWTNTRIVAYVPEQAALGPTSLRVVVGYEDSNAVDLTVAEREGSGRILWSFEADGDNLWYRPAIAPDGTLYVHSNNTTDGIVYAIAPNGALKWIQHVDAWPHVPPTAGPDGTAYVGALNRVWAISSTGQIRWEFVDPGAQNIQIAPTIGPEGLLYGASELGLGAFGLDPDSGDLVWSNTGTPYFYDFGTPFGAEGKFGPSEPGGDIDQFYVHMEGSANGNGYIWAFGLDGEQRFIAPMGGIASHEPVVGSDGAIYCPFGTDGGWGLRAVDPGSGSILWQHQPQVPNTMTELAIGPDDTIYYQASGRLEALDPHTQSLKWIDANFDVIGWPSVSPDGSKLLVHGVPNYGDPGFIRCYNASNGHDLWQVGLPGAPYPGPRWIGTHHARFTPDGSTAYVSTVRLGDGSPSQDPHSLLIAIEIFAAPVLPADIDGDGDVDGADLGLLLGAWGSCNGPEDLDGDGSVDGADLGTLLGSWSERG